MFYHIHDFIQDWENESKATLKVMQQLTDNSLQQPVTLHGRSLGRIAWHIVLSLGEMAGRTGLKLQAPAEDAPIPATAQEIARAYEKAAVSCLQEVQKWQDADLLKEDDMYGEMWKRGFSLEVLVRHEIHHRGQMTVLMRQAGVKVPGVYGPAAEEWTQYGMPAQA
jgi:uncharacterized damage-inducible protein DinB